MMVAILWCPELFVCGHVMGKKIPFEKIEGGRIWVVRLKLCWVNERLDSFLCVMKKSTLSIPVVVLSIMTMETCYTTYIYVGSKVGIKNLF